MDSILTDRLQTYLRHSATQLYEAVSIPPFTLFFHPNDSFAHFNYAIPNKISTVDLSGPLSRLKATFRQRNCTPRFEYIAEFAPNLAETLQQHGFQEESRTLLMTCNADSYQSAPDVPGLTITSLSLESELADFRAVMEVQHQGFNMTKRDRPSDEDVIEFRDWLGKTTFFLARLNGLPVSAGSLMPPVDGLAEVAGIATLPDYRRQGIATKLTDIILKSAFQRGVNLALLTAGDAQAGRVYERVGFQPVATALAYSAEST